LQGEFSDYVELFVVDGRDKIKDFNNALFVFGDRTLSLLGRLLVDDSFLDNRPVVVATLERSLRVLTRFLLNKSS